MLAVFLGGQGAARKCYRKGKLAWLGVTSRFHRERADQSSCKNKAAGRELVSVLNKMKLNPKKLRQTHV